MQKKRFLLPVSSIARCVLALFIVILLICTYPAVKALAEDPGEYEGGTTSGGYTSWIRGTSDWEAYQTQAPEPEISESLENDDRPDTIEKLLAKIPANIGTGINGALKGDNGTNGKIDASLTGVVMGKVANSVSYFVFDLSDKNIYGRIGASIYVILRVFAFAILFITTLFGIIKTMYIGNGKGLAELKDSLLTAVLVMLMLFMMPQIVDWLCEARDTMSVVVHEGVSKLAVGDAGELFAQTLNLEGQYWEIYDETPNFLNACVYLMVCCVPFIFIINYLKIAVQQTILFGLFPVFAMLTPKDKKSLSEWMCVVFSNIFIPCIDITLLMLPMLVTGALNMNGARTTGSLLKAIVVVVMFMGIIPCRNQILTMLGNKFGFQGGLGLFGAALMAGKAIHSAASAAGSAFRPKNEENGSDDKEVQAGEEALLEDKNRMNGDMGEVPPQNAPPTAESSAPSAPEAAQEDKPDEMMSANAAYEANEKGGDQVVNDADEVQNSTNTFEGAHLGDIPGGESAKDDTPAPLAEAQAAAPVAGVAAAGTAGENSPQSTGGSSEETVSATPQSVPVPDVLRAEDETFAPGMEEIAMAAVTAETLDQGMKDVVEQRAQGHNGLKNDANGKTFNKERGANLQTIDNLRVQSRKLDEKSGREKLHIAKKTAELARADTDERREELRSEIHQHRQNIELNNAAKQSIHAEIDRRRGMEREMAQKSEHAGRGGRTFDSAEEFKEQLKFETKVRKLSDYRNFDKDSTAFSGVEKDEFKRTRELHDARSQMLKMAAGGAVMTAGLGLTGLATLAAASGGEDAMRQVAGLGIGLSTDPAIPRAVTGIARTADQATNGTLSSFARAGARAAVQGTTAVGRGVKNSSVAQMARNTRMYQAASEIGKGAKEMGSMWNEASKQSLKDVKEYGKKK